jgi:YVTN family beta-propeller protein
MIGPFRHFGFLILFLLLASIRGLGQSPCGTELGQYRSVPAYSNGQFQGSGNSCETSGSYGLRYQCVEYVKRFYDVALGINTSGWRGNGVEYYDSASQKGLERFDNGDSTPPAPDDIVVFSGGTYGHVAIITSVTQHEVTIIEQNFSPTGRATLQLTNTNGNYSIAPRGHYRVLGWLRRPSANVVRTVATLNGTPWLGSVDFSIVGPNRVLFCNQGGCPLPDERADQPAGQYTFTYKGGGPANSTLTAIHPSSVQTLTAGGSITFTLQFASSDSGERAYITKLGSNSVSVINTTTNEVIGSIPVGSSSQWGIAIHPSGSRVYLTDPFAGTVTVVDAVTNMVIKTISVPDSPIGIAIDRTGDRVYVKTTTNVSVIATNTNTVVATISTGLGSGGIAITPDGIRIFAVNPGSTSISVINAANNTVIATIPTFTSANGIVINRTGTRAFVANGGGGEILIIDTATNTVSNHIPLPDGTCSCLSTGVAVSPDGNTVYMPHFGLNSIAVADVTTNSVIGFIPVGDGPEGISLNFSGSRLYVANRGSGTVSVIDTASNTVLKTITVTTDLSNFLVPFGQFVGPGPP